MKLSLLGLALVFTLAIASAASAQPGEFDAKGVLQPLADGFPNHAVTLVVIDDPGTRDGIYARDMQKALKDISPVPINVSDEPLAIGGTFDKLVEFRARPGGNDGYYNAVIDLFGAGTDPICYPIADELGVTIDDMNMVITTDRLARLFIQRKNTPWGPTFKGLVDYINKNPGKVVYSAPSVGSGSAIVAAYMLDKIGVYDKIREVPAASLKESNTVVAAGMGDFAFSRMDSALPHYQAGKIDILMFSGPVPPPFNKDPNIVQGDVFGLSPDLTDILLGYAVTRFVPDTHVDWLYKLFKAGAETDVYKGRETMFPGTRIGPILDPKRSMEVVKEMIDAGTPIITKLGLTWQQQAEKAK